MRLTLSVSILLCFAAARAEEPRKFEGEINDAKNKLQWTRDMAAGIENNTQYLGEFGAGDVAKMRAAWLAEVDLWTAIAAAYEKGDEPAAKSLKQSADKMRRASELWQLRLDARGQQRQNAPEKNWWDSASQWGPDSLHQRVEALCRAKRAAADAWGDLADALTPDSDPAEINRLRDRAVDLSGEAEIAAWDLEWTVSRENLVADKKISSPELTRLREELQKIDQERFKLKREEMARQRRIRDLDIQRHALEKKLLDEFESRRKAKEEAERNKR